MLVGLLRVRVALLRTAPWLLLLLLSAVLCRSACCIALRRLLDALCALFICSLGILDVASLAAR